MVTNLLTGKEYTPNMLPMSDANGRRLGMLWEPGHQMHGWIHYTGPDGQWVTWRMGLPHELTRAAQLVEFKAALNGVPCKT